MTRNTSQVNVTGHPFINHAAAAISFDRAWIEPGSVSKVYSLSHSLWVTHGAAYITYRARIPVRLWQQLWELINIFICQRCEALWFSTDFSDKPKINMELRPVVFMIPMENTWSVMILSHFQFTTKCQNCKFPWWSCLYKHACAGHHHLHDLILSLLSLGPRSRTIIYNYSVASIGGQHWIEVNIHLTTNMAGTSIWRQTYYLLYRNFLMKKRNKQQTFQVQYLVFLFSPWNYEYDALASERPLIRSSLEWQVFHKRKKKKKKNHRNWEQNGKLEKAAFLQLKTEKYIIENHCFKNIVKCNSVNSSLKILFALNLCSLSVNLCQCGILSVAVVEFGTRHITGVKLFMECLWSAEKFVLFQLFLI